jgi:hypothetical protein
MIWAMCAPCLGQTADQGRPESQPATLPYRIVDTGQKNIFGDRGQLLKAPGPSEPFFGQDAQYKCNPSSYTISGDGLTVRDNVTGLAWQRSPDTNGDGALTGGDKLTWAKARALPAKLNAARYGGYGDWRLPTIKELYSLINFNGTDPSPMASGTAGLRPFIDANCFKFAYGQTADGERVIDSQYASGTLYVNKTWRGFSKLFGVNFADGRIKGYDLTMPGGREKTFFVLCVRGNTSYGRNDLVDNGDKTVTDRATGLMWSKEDSGKGMAWKDALAWVQARNKENYLGHNDWRVPSAKELQGIVDYARSPDTTGSAAIDAVFTCTRITNEAGAADYPCYWTATTHGAFGDAAVYVAFGRAMGYMAGAWRDVHGAGAQRSDPKAGDPADFPRGRGPQGDAIRILNYVRPVRSVDPKAVQLAQPDLKPLPEIPGMRPPPYGPPPGIKGRPRPRP